MKTSNKLLLSFVGLMVLLMFVTDIVVWANYKKGRNGDGPIPPYKPWQTLELQPFKVLIISSTSDRNLFVSNNDKYIITTGDEKREHFQYSQHGDTLELFVKRDSDCALSFPTVEKVIVKKGGFSLGSFQLTKLQLEAMDSTSVNLVESKIGNLTFRSGVASELQLDNNAAVDTLHAQMGKHSHFRSLDVPYKQFQLKADSLKELKVEGRSAESFKMN